MNICRVNFCVCFVVQNINRNVACCCSFSSGNTYTYWYNINFFVRFCANCYFSVRVYFFVFDFCSDFAGKYINKCIAAKSCSFFHSSFHNTCDSFYICIIISDYVCVTGVCDIRICYISFYCTVEYIYNCIDSGCRSSFCGNSHIHCQKLEQFFIIGFYIQVFCTIYCRVCNIGI
ncbi:unknown [Clostridium sp. CAG:306]|nr:unknown [Clostridium sp. CAG:306]